MSKPIEFDVETTGFQPYSGHYPFMFQFYDGETAEAFTWSPDDDSNRPAIQAWFDRCKSTGIRAWNAKFDRSFADTAGFDIPGDGLWHDGMLDAHAINERRSVALKNIAADLFGKEAKDDQQAVKDWLNAENRRRRAEAKKSLDPGNDIEPHEFEPANYSDVPLDIMTPYGLEDVLLQRKCCDSFEIVFANKPDLKRVVEFERETLDSLYAIEKRGVPARREEYTKLMYEVAENLEKLEDRVMELADDPDFNPRSSAQVIEALKRREADLQFMSEKNGKLSADAENLRAVDDELATAILDFRAEAKVLSTYVMPFVERTYVSAINSYKQPFIADDGRIHATYRQVGARTGRMSCSDPNMQNQPRDDLRLRYNIVADPGYKLVTCDLSNIEMVLFAAYCGEGRLLDAINAGEDLHVLTANALGFRDRARAGAGYESARQQGKVYNFTTIYGGGLRSIKRYFRCSMDEARLYKARYAKMYPEVGRLQSRIDYAVEDRGYLQDTIISGRRFRVNRDESYKGTNYVVQGTAAALLKYAVNLLHKDGVPMVALVHDEIVAHVPQEDAPEVRDLIIERLTYHPALEGIVPLRADGDIVDRWSDAKVLTEEGTNKKYLFDPEWAKVERRYVEAV